VIVVALAVAGREGRLVEKKGRRCRRGLLTILAKACKAASRALAASLFVSALSSRTRKRGALAN